MTFRQPVDIRSFAFGEPNGDLAGTVSVWDGGFASSFGDAPPRVEGPDPEEEWFLAGAGFELTFAPTSKVAELELGDGALTSQDQLAHVHGTVVVGGGEHPVDCPGLRSRRVGGLDGKRFDSRRAVSAWFGTEDGLAVLAARPRRARGHDNELLAAALFEGGHAVPVADPRLSTAYDAGGIPTRVGLELWMSDDEGEHARRAAGEATPLAAVSDDPPLRAGLLTIRMSGREGIGVYELLRAR